MDCLASCCVGWERSVTPPRTVVTVTAGGEDPGTATGNIIGVEFPRAGEGASVDRDGSSVGGYASEYGSYGGRIGGSALAGVCPSHALRCWALRCWGLRGEAKGLRFNCWLVKPLLLFSGTEGDVALLFVCCCRCND